MTSLHYSEVRRFVSFNKNHNFVSVWHNISDIMRNYNADIYGYSTGTGTKNSRNSKLNVAVPGAVTE